jgi:hypothetical protein
MPMPTLRSPKFAVAFMCLALSGLGSVSIADELRPHEITYHTTFRGFSGHDPEHQTELFYDWSRNRLTGKVGGKPYDAALESGQQDVNTIRLAPVVDLLEGREPGDYALLDGRDVKHFTYPKKGTAKLQTEIGELETVIYESERRNFDGTGRTWRYWFAPSLGFLPVRIEQREDGRARLTFTVRTLKWTGAARPSGN